MHMVSIPKPSPARLSHQLTHCQLHLVPARRGVRLDPCHQLMVPRPVVHPPVPLQSAPRDLMVALHGTFHHWRTCMVTIPIPEVSPVLLTQLRKSPRLLLHPFNRSMEPRPMVHPPVSLRSAPRDPMVALHGTFHWRTCLRRSSQAQLTRPHRRRQLHLQRDRRVVPSARMVDLWSVALRSPVLPTSLRTSLRLWWPAPAPQALMPVLHGIFHWKAVTQPLSEQRRP